MQSLLGTFMPPRPKISFTAYLRMCTAQAFWVSRALYRFESRNLCNDASLAMTYLYLLTVTPQTCFYLQGRHSHRSISVRCWGSSSRHWTLGRHGVSAPRGQSAELGARRIALSSNSAFSRFYFSLVAASVLKISFNPLRIKD
jgi:hypothetical protein